MSLDELYQDTILDHHKHPRHRVALLQPQVEQRVFNPLCGDEVTIQLSLHDGRVSEVGFQGHGCAISQASASMLCELIQGQELHGVAELEAAFHALMKGEKSVEELAILKDALCLEGVKRFPARQRCALIAWEAVELCCKSLRPT